MTKAIMEDRIWGEIAWEHINTQKDLKTWKKLLLYSEDRSKVSGKIQQEILFKWTSIHHANKNDILNNEQRNSCIQSIILDIIRYQYITWITYNTKEVQ